MGGSASDTGSESEQEARAATLGPSDYSTKNWNGGGVQLNASGRAKMGYDDFTGGDNDGGSSNNNNTSVAQSSFGSGVAGNSSGGGSKYNPSGMNVSTDVLGNSPGDGPIITDFLSEAQSTEFRMGKRKDTGADPNQEFIKSGALGNALQNALGGGMGFQKAVSPFSSKSRGRFLKAEGGMYANEIPGADATVEQQGGSATPGGEVGVGQQSFGQRALGGADQVVENMAPPGAEQTETPVSQSQSDVQPDPNLPTIAPGASVVPDVNYVLPTSAQGQIIAFSPNDPQAVFTARGPLSRNLITERTGFGSKFI